MVYFYSKDLEEVTTVENEWFHWKALLKALKVTDCSPYKMLTLMLKNNFSTSFPNIYILPRHYLTLPVTNCTGERSFSPEKRTKSTLRSTQTQDDLSLLNIECDLLQKLDFYEIIDACSAKCRKRCF